MAGTRPADPFRIEMGTLQKNVPGRILYPRADATEYTANAHPLRFAIAYHQILRTQRTFHFVQGKKFGTFRQSPDNHLPAGNFIHVECMKRLPQLVKYEIGDIHHIADRAYPNR